MVCLLWLEKDEAGIKELQRWRHDLHLGEQKESKRETSVRPATTGYHQRLAHIMTDIPGNLGTQHSPVLWTTV